MDDVSPHLIQVDARIEILNQLLDGPSSSFRLVFSGAQADGIVSSELLADFAKRTSDPNTRQFLLAIPPDALRRPALDVGEVWFGLVEQDELVPGSPIVFPRRIRCRVGRTRSLVSQQLKPWAECLQKLVDNLGSHIEKSVPNAVPSWTNGAVHYAVMRIGSAEEQYVKVVSIDRSHELAAAAALVSEAFGAAWPGGVVALGMVDADGTIQPLPDELCSEKISGLFRSLPTLDTLLVAKSQVMLARKHAPSHVSVLGLEHCSQLGDLLGVRPADFRGSRKEGFWDRGLSDSVSSLDPLLAGRVYAGRAMGSALAVYGAEIAIAILGQERSTWGCNPWSLWVVMVACSLLVFNLDGRLQSVYRLRNWPAPALWYFSWVIAFFWPSDVHWQTLGGLAWSLVATIIGGACEMRFYTRKSRHHGAGHTEYFVRILLCLGIWRLLLGNGGVEFLMGWVSVIYLSYAAKWHGVTLHVLARKIQNSTKILMGMSYVGLAFGAMAIAGAADEPKRTELLAVQLDLAAKFKAFADGPLSNYYPMYLLCTVPCLLVAKRCSLLLRNTLPSLGAEK